MPKSRLAAPTASLRARLRRRIMNFRMVLAQARPAPTEEAMQAYRQALETMPEHQRSIFLLHIREDRSIAEIAGRLSLDSQAVEQLLGQAIAHICDRLAAPLS